jgi:quercetin dioxygenase-like cupin family protein
MFAPTIGIVPAMADSSRVVWMPGGVRTEVQLAGDDTGGAFCLLVDEPPPGWSLPRHRHRNEAETIHVVDGEFEVEIDGEIVRLGPGETAHVPRGVPHASRNAGDRPGRRLLIFSPAGIERFFLEAGAPRPESASDPEAIAAVAQRHGWEFG